MSSDQRSDGANLVIIAARRSTYVQIADILRHWSALDLTSPVLVVDVDALRPEQPLIPATMIERGRALPLVLQDHLATRARTDRVRVVCVTEVAEVVSAVHTDQALTLLDAVRASLHGVVATPLHVIGLSQQAADIDDDVAWLGWHNVALAPENAMGPDHGVLPIVHDPHDPVRRTHLVAGICSMAGIWAERPNGVFDDTPIPPSRSLVAARAFSRHLSAQQVESHLLVRLSDVRNGFPVPRVDGSPLEVVEDAITASGDMAEALVTKHAAHLRPRARQPLAARPKVQIGLMQALKMFFGFLWAALKNAPRAFADRVVNEVSSRTARLATGAVFGAGDSDYAVIVNGVGADGLPASLGELNQALESAQNKLRNPQSVHASAADLGPVWKDFISGALTLMDGGSRVQELAPIERGGRRAVVLDPARVAPDPKDSFVIPEVVAAHLKNPQIAGYDLLAARRIEPELKQLGQRQPHISGPAEGARQSLRTWGGEKRNSYVGRVGDQIAHSIHSLRVEVEELAAQAREAMSVAELPAEIEAQQRTLATKLNLAFGLMLLAIAVLVGLRVAAVLGVGVLLGGVAVAIVAWLVISVMMFLKGQQALFALLHRRQDAGDRLKHVNSQLFEALEDLSRLTRAYGQYRQWARALGAFIHQPFGIPSVADEYDVVLGSGLPHNHRFGAARPDEAILDEAAARLRRELFHLGWAGEAWHAFVNDVPAEVGDDAFRVREEQDVLFREVGASGDPLLKRWSRAVAERTVWEGGVTNLRAQVTNHLDTSGAELAPRLLASVETRATNTGLVEIVGYDTFMNRLDQPSLRGAVQHAFDRRMFSDSALSNEPWRVADTVVLATLTGLARNVVVIQLSGGFNAYDLAANKSAASSRDDAPTGVTQPDVHRPTF